MSIADGDTTTLVDGGFATEYCFALHACKMSWVVALLKEVQLKQDFSSRGHQGSSAGILQAIKNFRPYSVW